MRRTLIMMTLMVALVAGACAADVAESEEYQELEARLSAVQEELAAAEEEVAYLQEETEAQAEAESTVATEMPAEVTELLDEWLAAVERNDGSITQLYVPGGYHLYGGRYITLDRLDDHLNAPGWTTEIISGPYLVVAEPEGRYVVTMGLRNTSGSGAYASAFTFELVSRDGELKVAETNWTDVTF